MLEKILWKKTLGNRELFVITKHFQPLAHRSQVYTEQQEQLGRPLSPSLTVYKQAVPAISSITNRMCGIALSLGFGAAGAAASVGGDVPSLIYAAQDAVPGFIYISKFAVVFPFAYHWLAGVRHQIWNYQNPDLINLQFAPKSSYAIFTTAALLGVAATGYTIRSPIYKEQGSKQQ